ncbi:MAG TPA: DUF4388 domain-containing protein [Mycobacteriales bacterium]|nr:DUF4388 domain-containing protein [Mycobacteriales bacterium]
MNLEGSLEAFSLPDIFQLLSFTKKTGALHITRPTGRGVVYFTAGAITGGASDTSRQSLARRLVGTGLVDDTALAAAVQQVKDDPSVGLARALQQGDAVEDGVLHEQVVEQATDAVFDLLRWTQGEFAFVVDEANPDDLAVSLVVEDLVTEGRSRLEKWDELTRKVPSPEAVVTMTLAPAAPETTLSAEEWSLLALVDGERTVSQLVAVTGRGEFATVRTLASLVDRGLVSARTTDGADDAAGVNALLRRQATLSLLEGRPEPAPVRRPAPPPAAAPAPNVPEVVPTRPEPIITRQPEFAEQPVVPTARVSGTHRTEGSAALAEPAPGTSSLIERDPNVNKSLLLRLIAGVRGL